MQLVGKLFLASGNHKKIEIIYKIFTLSLNKGQSFFYFMARGHLTKEEMKYQIMKLKQKLYTENVSYTLDPKSLASKYLNLVLEKIDEYSR